jgi:hypothetical protein
MLSKWKSEASGRGPKVCPIFVRIGAHAVKISGHPVRIVDLAEKALWSIFVRIGTGLFDQILMIFVRIGTRDPLQLSGVLP